MKKLITAISIILLTAGVAWGGGVGFSGTGLNSPETFYNEECRIDGTSGAFLWVVNQDMSVFGEGLGPELVTNGDFEDGTNNWNAYDATFTVESFAGHSTCAKLVATNSDTIYIRQDTSNFAAGELIEISFDYYIPSTNTTCDGIRYRSQEGGLVYNTVNAGQDEWISISYCFITSGAGNDKSIYMIYGGDINGITVGDIIYIDSVSFRTVKSRYKITVTDSSGYQLVGWAGGAGAGLSLGSEIATGTLTSGALYQITATELNHFGTGLTVDDYFTSDGTETCDASNKVKRVSACGGTGLNIYSTQLGSTRGRASQDEDFGYNATDLTVKVSR